MGKNVPLWLLALVVFVGINLVVLFGWSVQYVNEGGKRLGRLGPVVTTIASFPSLVKEALYEVGLLSYKARDGKADTVTRPPQLIENRFPELDGFKKNGLLQAGAANDPGYLLESVYDYVREQAVVRLVRIRDGQVLHEWVPDLKELAALHDRSSFNLDFYPAQIRPVRYRIMHPLLLDDGDLIFHGNGPMFRIDACSRVKWVLDKHFHHAIEADANGDIWTGSLVEPSNYSSEYFGDYIDESIVKVSPEGKVLFEKSISQILEENGQRGLLFGTARYEHDNLHFNDAQPALYSTDYWKKGDLLVSVRNRSVVFLYRPSTNKILWLQVGPWLLQHDPDFVGQSKISVFGNDVIRRLEDGKEFQPEGHNNVYVFDFATGETTAPWRDIMREEKVSIDFEGLHEILDNGDVYIEETMNGRLLRLSKDAVVWEAVSRVDDNTLAMLTWSRYLTEQQVEKVLPRLESAQCS
jgi:hypothetical protein